MLSQKRVYEDERQNGDSYNKEQRKNMANSEDEKS